MNEPVIALLAFAAALWPALAVLQAVLQFKERARRDREAAEERERMLDRFQSRSLGEYDAVRMARETPAAAPQVAENESLVDALAQHPDLADLEYGQDWDVTDDGETVRVARGPDGDRDVERFPVSHFLDEAPAYERLGPSGIPSQ